MNAMPAFPEVPSLPIVPSPVPRRYSTEHVSMTPADAVKALTAWKYGGQRSISQDHINYLSGMMARGEMKTLGVDLAVVGEQRYLVNGQHSLGALASFAENQPDLTLTARISETTCADMHDVAILFTTFDRPRVRTHAQMLDALGVAEKTGLSKDQVRYFTYALSAIDSGFGEDQKGAVTRTRSSLYRASLTEAWVLEASTFFDAVAGAHKEVATLLKRAPVMAVALVTLRYQEERATRFWRNVSLDDGLQRGTPEHTLLAWLRTTPSRIHRYPTYARYVATAWNAYYKHKSPTRLQVKDASTPIVILGTPYSEYKQRRKPNDV